MVPGIRYQVPHVRQKSMRCVGCFSHTVSIALVFCLVFINILNMFNTN